MRPRRSLKSLVFAALKRAGAENRLDVAEHLLYALEVLDSKDVTSSDRHSRLTPLDKRNIERKLIGDEGVRPARTVGPHGKA